MKRIKESAREQGVLFSNYFVGDRLPGDHEVYLFNRLIDKLNIKSIIDSYSPEGGSMYSPRDHLAVIVYAYFKGITSSIQISELTAVSLPFIYLSGGYHIKSKTIRTFRLKHKEALRKIFVSTISLASDVNLIDLSKVFALDGSKFEANASFSKTLKKKEWQERQRKIIQNVDDYLAKWEAKDQLEENLEDERKAQFDRVKKKLDKLKNQSVKEEADDSGSEKSEEKISDKKENKFVARKKEVKVNNLDKAEQLLDQYESVDDLLDGFSSEKDDLNLSLTDPDCRVMQNDSTVKESYNVQAITNNQVIVAVEVTQDENDQAQLEPMVEQLKNNLDISEGINLLADAGYNRGKNLAYIDNEENIYPYISMYDRSKEKKEKAFLKENFIFDEDNERWLCPEGNNLDFIKDHISENKKFTLYGCNKEHCIFCPENNHCITTKEDQKRGYRTIDDDGYTIYRKEMLEKMSNSEAKEIYRQRAGEVEPVFGQIKANRSFTRFRLTGLTKVNIEFMLVSIAHNLSKIIKQIKRVPTIAEQYAI